MTITECISKMIDNNNIYETINILPFYTDTTIIIYGKGIELYVPINCLYKNKWYKRKKDIHDIIVEYIAGNTILDILNTIRNNNKHVCIDYKQDDNKFVQIVFD